MFDFTDAQTTQETGTSQLSYGYTKQVVSETIKAQRVGACNFGNCSCTSFVYSNDAQFCDNCGHSRSSHSG